MSQNNLVEVQTLNDAGLAYLLNSFAVIRTANREFDQFQNIANNLGAAVGINLPVRYGVTAGLNATFQAANQRVHTLPVDKQANVSSEFTTSQIVYNFTANDYMKEFGRGAMKALGTYIEEDVSTLFESAPYRMYGDGVTPISSGIQLAEWITSFRIAGAAAHDTRAYLDPLTYVRVVNSNLNQFTPARNNREAFSWEVGSFDDCDFYRTNMLPIHTSGTEGQQGSVLTVDSTTLNADGAVTAITFSGTNAAFDADSVKKYDKFTFSDGVAGQPNLRLITYIGNTITPAPVQFKATDNAQSTGGSQVTVNIYPALQPNANIKSDGTREINNTIVPGMQVTVLPSHRCGCVMSGNPLYLAMPSLPTKSPYETAISSDPESKASIRMYTGSQFGVDLQGTVHDAKWGRTLLEDYCMGIALPL